MKKRNIKKVMAYFYVPLLFISLNIIAVTAILYPMFDDIKAVANLLLLDEVPEFSTGVEDVAKSDLINKFNESRLNYTVQEVVEDEEVQEIIPLSEIAWPVYGDPYAWISCERLGIDSVLYYGDGYELLRKGVGQYIGSYIPGYGRPLMVCAHNTKIFACLEFIEIGDIIHIDTEYGSFEYEVNDIQILLATDMNAYDMQLEKEQLIMYTCYPFERLSTRHKYRYFVYCDKISGPILKKMD